VSDEEAIAVLLGIWLSVEDDFRCPKSGYSTDMRVQDMRLEILRPVNIALLARFAG